MSGFTRTTFGMLLVGGLIGAGGVLVGADRDEART